MKLQRWHEPDISSGTKAATASAGSKLSTRAVMHQMKNLQDGTLVQSAVLVMCGLPASGKTSAASLLAALTCEERSIDDVAGLTSSDCRSCRLYLLAHTHGIWNPPHLTVDDPAVEVQHVCFDSLLVEALAAASSGKSLRAGHCCLHTSFTWTSNTSESSAAHV